MRKSLIAGSAAVLAAGGIAAAQTAPPAPPVMIPVVAQRGPQVPPNVQAREIPDVLLTQISAGSTIERYVASVVGQLRSADHNGDGLDRGDIELGKKIRRAQSRGSMIGQILRYDLDGDFVVTRQELEQSLGNSAYAASGADNELRQFDQDHDGRITLAEAAQAQPSVRFDDMSANSLLALDPNGDGKLTPAELQPMAERAFKIVDRDGDGTISKDENAAIAEQRNMVEWLRTRPRCAMPAVPDGALTVAYGTYRGSALSSAAIGGQDQETNLIDIVIEPGPEPLYLVLSSYESMVWRLKGDTRRVAQVVVHSREGVNAPTTADRISASGVVGVPAAKVAIQYTGCLDYFDRPTDAQGARSLALIERALGRTPDAAFGSYSTRSVSLPSGAIMPAIRDSVPVPQGFDPQTWPDATRFWPDGLVNVDPKTVVAKTKVEPYEVLPSQMGLSQLVGSGAVQYVSWGKFRILKPIAHWPPRMTGAHSATLILAKGVPLPPGDSGHSCVISEETEQPLIQGRICPGKPQ